LAPPRRHFGTSEFNQALEMMDIRIDLESRRIDPIPMTTHRFKFSELDKAFEVMDKKLDGVIKPSSIF